MSEPLLYLVGAQTPDGAAALHQLWEGRGQAAACRVTLRVGRCETHLSLRQEELDVLAGALRDGAPYTWADIELAPIPSDDALSIRRRGEERARMPLHLARALSAVNPRSRPRAGR